jgi:hypothetical protein
MIHPYLLSNGRKSISGKVCILREKRLYSENREEFFGGNLPLGGVYLKGEAGLKQSPNILAISPPRSGIPPSAGAHSFCFPKFNWNPGPPFFTFYLYKPWTLEIPRD